MSNLTHSHTPQPTIPSSSNRFSLGEPLRAWRAILSVKQWFGCERGALAASAQINLTPNEKFVDSFGASATQIAQHALFPLQVSNERSDSTAARMARHIRVTAAPTHIRGPRRKEMGTTREHDISETPTLLRDFREPSRSARVGRAPS